MEMKRIYYCIGGIALSVALVACGNDAQKPGATAPAGQPETVVEAPAMTPEAPSAKGGKVTEVMDASGYTYLGIDDGSGSTLWAAVPKTTIDVGEEVTLQGGSVMTNFSSKTLDRTFDEIIFASGLVRGGSDQMPSGNSFADAVQGEGGAASQANSGGSAGAVVAFSDLKVEKAAGENARSVGEIFAQAAELDTQKVAIKGQVVKISRNIMGKNWLHIQDGTGDPMSNTHDLVVTTSGEAEKGAIVVIEGVVAANKDFGSGYRYDVIVEEAVVTQ